MIRIFVLILAAMLLSFSAVAQPLNGSYGGEASGSDTNGQILHQIAQWKFVNGALMAFTEVITFPRSGSIFNCSFTPAQAAPLPYFTNLAPNDNYFILMHGLGCPNPSTNNRAEMLLVIPENNGVEFSYLEYTSPFAIVTDPDPAAHFAGRAVKKVIP